MTVTRKKFVGNYPRAQTIDDNIAAMTQDNRPIAQRVSLTVTNCLAHVPITVWFWWEGRYVIDAACFVYACRRLIDLSLILLCIYMPAIDRPLSDCRYKSGNDQTGEVTVAPGKSTKFNTNHSDKWQATVSGEAKTLHEWTIDGRDGAFCTMEVRHPAYEEIQPRPGNHIGNPTTIDCHGYFVTGCLCCRSWDG